jgi:hypothetical protein
MSKKNIFFKDLMFIDCFPQKEQSHANAPFKPITWPKKERNHYQRKVLPKLQVA